MMTTFPSLGETFDEVGRVRRTITSDCTVSDGEVCFYGELHDIWTDESVEETLHWYRVKLTAVGAELTLIAAAAEPLDLPFPDCPRAVRSLEKLLGISMRRGFRRAARDALGDIEGCTHLLTLVLAIADAVIPSVYVAARVGVKAGQAPSNLSVVMDTCQGWRADGVAVQSINRGEGRPPRWRAPIPLNISTPPSDGHDAR
jgi:Protein of unknown function (DUF2889)